MIRFVGIDVDGTLIGASGEVDARVWQAADRARAAGIRLSLCTGRMAVGTALHYAQRLDPEGWHIFQNGASIVNLATGATHSMPLPDSALASMISYARDTGSILELYSDRDYVTESEALWARQHAGILGVPFAPRTFDSLSPPVLRAQWILSAEEVPRVTAAAPAGVEVARSSSPLMPHVTFIGMTKTGTTKGAALRTIAAEYKVSLSEAMFVGDSPNDLPALAVVGHPVAMGNADASVIKVAEYVVGHVDNAGLAEALAIAINTNPQA